MNMQLTTVSPAPQIIPSAATDVAWFPDLPAARIAVDDYLDTLPSTTDTEEQHTKNHYNRTLDRFEAWLGNDIPTEQIVQSYLGHLRREGCAVTSVNNYLAPIKLFCSYIAKQPIFPQTNPQYTEDHRFMLSEMRQAVSNVNAMRGLKAQRKSNLAGIDNPKHNRRPADQLLTILSTIKASDTPTLTKKRDHALWVFMLNSACRIAEAARLTLENFQRYSDDTVLIVNLQGKGNNYDPIPVPYYVYDLVKAWVAAYNDALPKNDPRRIQPHHKLWKPLTRAGNPFKVPRPAIHRRAIADIISKWSTSAGYPMAGHDTRRSATLYMRGIGMEHTQIQKVTRHQSLDMVQRYVGTETKWDEYNHALVTGTPLI